MDILANTGFFLYPLVVCSLVAMFVTVERFIALRNAVIIPKSAVDALIAGDVDRIQADSRSVVGRILGFCRERNPDPDAIKAFARLEVSRMERGMFLLEVVIGAAPLLGLLGTVTGMIDTFRVITLFGTSDPRLMSGGISEALTTTELGLAVAIPIMLLHAYISRRADHLIGEMEEKAVQLTNIIQKRQALTEVRR